MVNRGAGTSEGQGGQLFQRALSILYVQSLPQTLLSNIVNQLKTSTKPEYCVRRINTKNNNKKIINTYEQVQECDTRTLNLVKMVKKNMSNMI